MRGLLTSLAVIAATTISWSVAHDATYDSSTEGKVDASSGIPEARIRAAADHAGGCCRILTLLFPDYAFSDGDSYTKSLKSYWTQQAQSLVPSCIVIPKTSKQVADTVRVLTIASKFIKGECPFAVRSGGHTPWPGAANIQNGVTIDLSLLNQVTISLDRKSVSIGPGNLWGNVYKKLDAEGLATSGGRVSDVGVGGLVLGGGFSFFSPRVGLVCDNVLNYEIVLASGQVTNINATSNRDLFRALKGGSNNFGIVTRFDMKVFPQGKFWGGFLLHPIQLKDQFFKIFENFAKSKDYDPYAALIHSYSYVPAQGGWFIGSSVYYTKEDANAAVFAPFKALPPLTSTTRISNLTDFTIELSTNTPPGGRASFATATYKNSAKTMSRIYDLTDAISPSLANVKDLVFSLSFQPLPQIVLAPGFATTAGAGNVLGLSAADGDLVNVLVGGQWSDPADDAKLDAATRKLFADIAKVTKEEGTDNPYLYLNYAAEWQKPIQGYEEEQVRFLRKVSRDVDPGQVFQRLVKGGFKLNA